VSSETPLYPNFGDRNHYFESLDEALHVMKEWHRIAMAYNPTEEELAESGTLALQLWNAIDSRATIIDIKDDEESK
jgi:hypothetical protein